MKLQSLLGPSALLAATTLAALSPLADPGPRAQRQDPSRPPLWDLGVEHRNRQLHEAIRGAWFLTKHEHPLFNAKELSTRAYLLIGDGFLSLELHGIFFDGPHEEVVFQTGMHRFDFDKLGQLVTSSLIGTNHMIEDMPVMFERPGTLRRFRVVYGGETLELVRTSDQSRLTFRRLKTQSLSGRDIYGRELPDPDSEGEDSKAKGSGLPGGNRR